MPTASNHPANVHQSQPRSAHRRRLLEILQSPALSIGASVVLLASSLKEIIESADHFHVRGHHGVAVYALIHIARTLSELLERNEKLGNAWREVAEPDGPGNPAI